MTSEDHDDPTGPAASNAAANAQALPKCFCNWKNCRSYQKTFREYKHPLYNGVIKLKFARDDPKSMALKSCVERTLNVDSAKRNEWRDEGGVEQCRYYVARHHYTEALMKQYLADRRAWDWSEPLNSKDAKTYLWSLDRRDIYHSDDSETSHSDDDDSEDDRYLQAPNVPKDHVRDTLRKLKAQREAAQREEEEGEKKAPAKKTSSKRGNTAPAASGGVSSVHTQSTLSTSVTDTLKAFEDIIGPGEPIGGKSDHSGELLAQKEEENTRLRQELNDCQQQLSMLHNMVRQLKDDMDRNRGSPAPAPAPAPAPSKKSSGKSGGGKKRVQRDNSNSSDARAHPNEVDLTDDEDEGWSENNQNDEDDDDDDDEDEDEEEEEEWSNRGGNSDDDETISTFHVNYNGNRSSHSRHGSRHSVRKGSIHSRRSIRRDSVHSRRDSVHSRSRHSRRDSVHSRRSMRGGGSSSNADDGGSVHSRQSLQSVSPSIKSLPREIELMEEEEQNTKRDNDEYSFFDDSYRRPDDDARSVGSRSAASRTSRRSIVSGARRRTSRVGRSQKKKPKNPGNSVPREIDLSGDELEDETYANVSTDTQFVTAKNIVDPYGEKGVYTGALSKSTGMPNGKGRLEYEKEGRWYEGDWIHGRWTGYGRLSNGDGDYYEGGLKNDHKHGTGVMRFADGRVFEGEYIRGQMIQGKMTYQDGSVYGGSWVDGMRHGRGKCVFVDGSEYEGEFREGNFHGHGKMTWNDGGWYVGEWCDGEMHGKGKEIRPDGTLRHDGEWSRGQPIRSANDSHSRRRRQNQSGVEVN